MATNVVKSAQKTSMDDVFFVDKQPNEVGINKMYAHPGYITIRKYAERMHDLGVVINSASKMVDYDALIRGSERELKKDKELVEPFRNEFNKYWFYTACMAGSLYGDGESAFGVLVTPIKYERYAIIEINEAKPNLAFLPPEDKNYSNKRTTPGSRPETSVTIWVSPDTVMNLWKIPLTPKPFWTRPAKIDPNSASKD